MSNLIHLEDIHKAYGADVIFDAASVVFSRGDRVGVIGRNGAGKTTLLRLITGQEEPEAGQVRRASRLRLSYLEQESPFEDRETVIDYLQRESGKEDWQCGKVAGRFWLKGDLLTRPAQDLPGGYQTRVKLAAMLLGSPNFLILDEPTNYLDLRTLLILETFLRDFSGGYLVVSHDREFLERTCDRTLEVEAGKLTMFPGDVEAYLAWKEEQVELAVRQSKNIDAKRRSLQEYVDRYRVRAATASRAQSKLKQIERLEHIEIATPERSISLKLPAVEPKKGTALGCKNLAIGYPENSVATGIHFEIERGQHVAVLGDNGQGKTTLLRTLAGELGSQGGDFRWGHAIRTAYYAQHVYTTLPAHLEVTEYLEREAAPEVLRQEVLDLAGCFLFQGDDAHKKIEVLSGGERARLSLAGILLSRRPVLLLDEPTNHLDFQTVEALGRALSEYAGTLFFVSHDRTFVRLVATSIVEVKDGSVRLWPGDYESYVWQAEREIEEARAAESDTVPASRARSSGGAQSTAKEPTDRERRKERRARIRKLRRQVEVAERQIAACGQERDAIHQHYLDNPLDPSPERRRRLEELGDLVEAEEARWLELHEELETLEAEDED